MFNHLDHQIRWCVCVCVHVYMHMYIYMSVWCACREDIIFCCKCPGFVNVFAESKLSMVLAWLTLVDCQNRAFS